MIFRRVRAGTAGDAIPNREDRGHDRERSCSTSNGALTGGYSLRAGFRPACAFCLVETGGFVLADLAGRVATWAISCVWRVECFAYSSPTTMKSSAKAS